MILSGRVREYLTSGRFIHDNLVEFVDEYAEKLRKLAQRGEKLSPTLLFWIDGRVKADDGTIINDKVVMEFDDMENLERHIQEGAKKTHAYAVLLFSPTDTELRLELETPHGGEVWRMKRQKRGDQYLILPAERTSQNKVFGVIKSRLN